mgnify:CR=1 FL=1|jgi:hypothetical protein
MATANQVQVVSLQEFFELLTSKDPSTTSFIFFPVSNVFIGIIPKQIRDKPTIWDISGLWNLFDLLEAMHVFAEASMHAHNLFINEGHQGHVVEAVVEQLPQRNFVSPLDFVEEPVNPGNGLALVVATQNDNLRWISYLEREEKADDFTGLLASVYVVAHEQVSGVLGDDVVLLLSLVLVAHLFEHVKQVGVLPMNISEDLHRCLELNQRFFIFETFLSLLY